MTYLPCVAVMPDKTVYRYTGMGRPWRPGLKSLSVDRCQLAPPKRDGGVGTPLGRSPIYFLPVYLLTTCHNFFLLYFGGWEDFTMKGTLALLIVLASVAPVYAGADDGGTKAFQLWACQHNAKDPHCNVRLPVLFDAIAAWFKH
jgi:hypothetical protein